MTDPTIAYSATVATIDAPLASIDLSEWIFTLTESEYQACSKNHIAAATSRSPDGKRMSINVEQVGNLMVQHYVEDVSERARCRLVSQSDSIGPDIASRIKIVVIWSFAAEAIDANATKFTNSIEVKSTPAYLEALAKKNILLAKTSEAVQQAISAHNAEETPLFARDIERKALAGRWS